MSSRTPILIIAAILLIALSAYTFLPSARVVPRAQAVTMISLAGTITAWNATTIPNPTITVTQGDTVSISLTSTDTTHQFYVDVDRNGVADCSSLDKCSAFFTPTSPTTFTFSIDFAAGTYTYFCSVHPTSMLGSFVVKTNPAVGGSPLPVNKPALAAPYAIAAALVLGVLAVALVVVKYSRKTRTR